jgi:predicted anti-sigma-YlaC factor YlaD
MPAVALGRSEWLPAELEHLKGCPDCMAEWELVSAASQLGRSVTVDMAGLTPRLQERIRVSRGDELRRRWVRWSAVAGLAAAAVLLLTIVPRRQGVEPVVPQPATRAGAASLQLAELDDAAPSELELVLAEFDEPAVPGSSLDGPDVDDLDVPQVEHALRSWEES